MQKSITVCSSWPRDQNIELGRAARVTAHIHTHVAVQTRTQSHTPTRAFILRVGFLCRYDNLGHYRNHFQEAAVNCLLFAVAILSFFLTAKLSEFDRSKC